MRVKRVIKGEWSFVCLRVWKYVWPEGQKRSFLSWKKLFVRIHEIKRRKMVKSGIESLLIHVSIERTKLKQRCKVQ